MRHLRRWLVVLGVVLVVSAFEVAFFTRFADMGRFIAHPSHPPSDPGAVRGGLWFDSLAFIPFYLVAVSLSCWLPTRRLVRYRAVGRRLAWIAYAAAGADVLENCEAFGVLRGDNDALRWLRYATAAKYALIAVPAVFGLAALVAWASGRAVHPPLRAAAVAEALAWAQAHEAPEPERWRTRLACWVRGDRQPPPTVPPPDRAKGERLTGVSFSGGGIRSAAYNLGALQELQAAGELNRADLLASVSGGSYIAGAHAITGAFSSADAMGTVPPFAPGSVEEQYLRNRTTYLFPGLTGTGYALWRLVRGLVVNVGFIVLVLFVFARPYGWMVERQLAFGCPVYQGTTTTTSTTVVAGQRPDCAPVPKGVASKRTVRFSHFPWAGPPVLAAAALAVALGLVDMLVRPKERWAARLEAWSSRLAGLAVLAALFLYVLPALAARLITDATFHDSALDRLPAGTAVGGAVSALLTMVGLLRRAGPRRPVGEGAERSTAGAGGIVRRVKSGAAKAGDGILRLFMTVVGGVIGPVALGAAFLALAMGSVLRPGLDPAELGSWLLVITVLVLVQGVGDANRWSLQPYYKRRLQTAFALQRHCQDGAMIAEEIDFDEPLKLGHLLDTPRLVVCAAANLTNYGVLPPGRNVTTFTFSRTEIDAGILGTVPTPVLGTLLGPHYDRDFTVPAAVSASGAAVSPVMGKMTKPAYRFLFALTNVRLGVWLPNPRGVMAWAKDQPTPAVPGAGPAPAEHAAAQAAVAWAAFSERAAAEAARRVDAASTDDVADRQARLQAARMNLARQRQALARLEAEASPYDPLFTGYPWLPRPTLLFRELFGVYRSTARFVYVTDGGHYENLGLVELLRRGCQRIYCFDAAGDRPDRFTTVADAVAIARTELGVTIEIDPTPMAPEQGSEFNAQDVVRGTFYFAGARDTPGDIVFAKLGVVKAVPADVRSWRETHPTFPTDGTADQLYTDQRFEAYRALGAGTAVRAIAVMRAARGDDPQAEAGPLRRGSTGCP